MCVQFFSESLPWPAAEGLGGGQGPGLSAGGRAVLGPAVGFAGRLGQWDLVCDCHLF